MAETQQTGEAALRKSEQAPMPEGPMEKAQAAAAALRVRFMALPAGKRNWMVASVIFLAAVCAGMAWFASRPDWRALFTGLEGKDVQQVSQELSAAGIPFQLTPDGTGIQVPADMVDKARMEVAAKGMPQTGRLGFELFDKPNWVGSEFDERVNYQRAMEGELEHTIGTLSAVESARVHLVLPQPSLFTSEQKPAKASVVLKLRRGGLDPGQADAIRSLVAGSVENLSPDQVTLVDADGRVDLKPRSNDAAKQEEEQALQAKLVAMLEPLAGRDNVRATVNISYDEGTEEHTDEIYDPTQEATLSMQKSEQTSTPAVKPQGIPGTASNSPGAAAVGGAAGSAAAAAPGTPPLLQKEALPVYPQQGTGAEQSLREENGTYGVTKHLVHTEQGPGRVRRVTAAVVVNDRSVTEGAGSAAHVVWKPRSADEMRRLEELAQAAVGFDSRRGDQVVVENVSFSTNAPAIKQPMMDRVMSESRALLRTQPGLARTLVMGLCGLVLVLFVLRPIARQVTETLREPPLLEAGAKATIDERLPAPAEEWEQNAAASALAEPAPAVSRMQRHYQGIFEQVSEHIRREPAQSTRLLEAWIGTPEEAE
ncbi:flagellar basal-body MS-ring/collar protein FliF [Edaphobacter sp.]|uniref:flagellar basal-body MS-ring/collar protein FliF n=1 Tax=Edaphobacter sp. TaxID=1934404 RepID=UPI002DB5622E|nr:flagellar basal-body MS-ring/collar protein FliF [Edaphobacter sp.]HEU5342648.1 flagellar basal-body MS-ring/collar protein FliF [Edaphobacter sp.]